MTCLNSPDEDSPCSGMDFWHLWDHIGILTAFGSTGARNIEMDQGSSKVTDMTFGAALDRKTPCYRWQTGLPYQSVFMTFATSDPSLCRTRTSLYLSLPPIPYHIFANHNGAQSLGTSRHQKGPRLLALSRTVGVHLSHLRFKGVYQALGVFLSAQSKL